MSIFARFSPLMAIPLAVALGGCGSSIKQALEADTKQRGPTLDRDTAEWLKQAHWVEVKGGKARVLLADDRQLGLSDASKWRSSISARVNDNKRAPVSLPLGDALVPPAVRNATFRIALVGQPSTEGKPDGAVLEHVKSGAAFNTAFYATVPAGQGSFGLAIPADPRGAGAKVSAPSPLDPKSARAQQVVSLVKAAAKAKLTAKNDANAAFVPAEENRENADAVASKLAAEHLAVIPGAFGVGRKELVVINMPLGNAKGQVVTGQIYLDGAQTSVQGTGGLLLSRLVGHDKVLLLSDLNGDGVNEVVFERSDEAFVRSISFSFAGQGGLGESITLYEEER